MIKRLTILLASCFSVIVLVIFLQSRSDKAFFEKKVNSRIIDVENYYDKLLKFYYENGKSFSSRDINDTLRIGDSISKPANTFTFSVYRQKEDSSFFLYKQLTFE